jgi:hypothetical protein
VDPGGGRQALDRRGQPLVIKMTGAVEPYYLAPSSEAANQNPD